MSLLCDRCETKIYKNYDDYVTLHDGKDKKEYHFCSRVCLNDSFEDDKKEKLYSKQEWKVYFADSKKNKGKKTAIKAALNSNPVEVDKHLKNWDEGPLGGSGFS